MNEIKGIDAQTTARTLTRRYPTPQWPVWTLLGRVVLLMATLMPAWANPAMPLTAASAALPNHVPEQILVKPKSAVAEHEVQALFASHAATQVEAIHQINVRVLHVPEARLETVLAALKKNPNIEFAEPDYLIAPDLIPNDPYYPSEWYLPKIQAAQAWDITSGTNTIVVAILDTGVDASNPDLSGKLVSGWNFYDNNSDTSDVYGHGTGVAGAAVANGDNGIGVIAPAYGCMLMPIRISATNGIGSASAAANGLTWAADHGARVANISYAMWTISSVLNAAQYFQSKGGVVTISAGNDGKFYTNSASPYVLVVSATDQNDASCSWSTIGNAVALSAPGSGVWSTADPTFSLGYDYAAWTGTSISAPIVAGVAALVISVNPSLTANEIQNILETSADDLGPAGWDPQYGYGRVNAYKAVVAAGGNMTDTTPPTVAINSPTNGSTMSGTITVRLSASDNVAVVKVEWYLDGALAASSTNPSPAFSWDTTTSTNGPHTLKAKAYDAAGNTGTSASVSVTVQNLVPDTTPPIVTVTAPLPGATVSGMITVSVNASDNVGVTKVEWYLDGFLTGSSATVPASFSWKTTGSINGTHAVQAKAYDAAGNVGVSSLVSVTVQNALKAPPASQITSPNAGATISTRNTKVNVAATDGVGVTRVDLLVDGALYSSNTDSTPTTAWNTTFGVNMSKLAKGSHTLQSIAYDAAGYTGGSTLVTVYK